MEKPKELPEIKAGEYRNIDDYVRELKELGIDVDYENVINETSGFVAKVYVEGEHHCNWEGGPHGQMVRSVKRELIDIVEPEERGD